MSALVHSLRRRGAHLGSLLGLALLLVLLSACNSGTTVVVATPVPPDAGFRTYRHPGGAFSLRLPPEWSVRDLSGENPVSVGGVQKTIRTRFSGTPGMFDAAGYLQEYYEGLGLDVELWPYGTRGWVNVVATQVGRLHPEQVYIVSAHYDSTSGAPLT